MNDLKVSLIQSDLVWEDIKANQQAFQQKIQSIQEDTDFIVLPEMFTTGFSMNPHYFDAKEEQNTLTLMQKWAREKQAAILGSIISREDERFFNRAYFVFPDGNYETYDKRHLFRMGKEDRVYTAGKEPLLIHYKGWRIRPFICYDLRFPVWSRNTSNYDLAIYIANWPEARTMAWESLLKARAIENLSYVVGVNRVGEDGKGIAHNGASSLFDFKGECLFRATDHQESINTFCLKTDSLNAFREQFPAYLDADQFTIQ